MAELTPKQARFVDEYLIDLNATQAAIRAGYSLRTAEKIGSENLKKPDVMHEIQSRTTERQEQTGITAERVLQEISLMAFYDVGDILLDKPADELTESEAANSAEYIVNGRYVIGLRSPADIKRLPESLRRIIVGWGYDKNQNFTVKLADKSKALDQLARHLSLYNDKVEVKGFNELAERLARAANRDGD
jgi:phage terminase small subunit